MIEIDIPGCLKFQLKHIVLDYNGTIAFDGVLIPGVKENLVVLADQLEVHILTADENFRLVRRVKNIKEKWQTSSIHAS